MSRTLPPSMRCRSALVALVLVCPVASIASAQVALPPYLELRVPKAPTVGMADSGAFLTYELHVTNFSAQPMTLTRVDVLSDDAGRRVLFTLADSALTQSMSRPGPQIQPADRPKLAGGARGVVFLWIPVDARTVPTSLRDRVTVEQGSGDSVRAQQLEGASVPIARMGAPIGPPLRGGPWLAGNGPSARSGHRRSLIPIGGVPSIAQRFAIDYV